MTILPKILLSDKLQRREVKYLNKDYSDFKQSLIEFTKAYYPDTYQDFNEASPGSVFLDMAAFVGDVLSLYIDRSFRENLIFYTEEKENIVTIAQAMGLRIRNTAPAITNAKIYQICPADTDGNIDPTFLLRIDAGSRFNTNESVGAYPITFRSTSLIDFADPTNRTVQVYTVDGTSGLPTNFLLGKTVELTSGEQKRFVYDVSSAERFLKIVVPDTDIIGIESITDSEGNVWHEVENLAQDTIFEDTYQLATDADSAVPPAYTMKVLRTDRRFVVRLSREMQTEILFGGGNGSLDDIIINFDPKQVNDPEYNQQIAVTPISDINLTNSNTFGLAPANTSFTIKYIQGGGVKDNVPSNTITNVLTLNVVNDVTNYTTAQQSQFNSVVDTVSIINPTPATGGADVPTVEEIRQIALAYFSAQSRVVTRQDYAGRILAMPGRYGAAAKVFVTADEQINKVIDWTRAGEQRNKDGDPNNNIIFVEDPPKNNSVEEGKFVNAVNVYLLGYDRNKRLTTLNTLVKTNVKNYISPYRMLTDQVNIYDAFVVNIKVIFDIVVQKNYNMNDTLARCMDIIKDFFNMDNWQIGQPIILSELQLAIASIDGVQGVTSLRIDNLFQQQNGRDYQPYRYNIEANTQNGVILPSVDPCIFELRYPEDDIIGSARQ